VKACQPSRSLVGADKYKLPRHSGVPDIWLAGGGHTILHARRVEESSEIASASLDSQQRPIPISLPPNWDTKASQPDQVSARRLQLTTRRDTRHCQTALRAQTIEM